MKGFRLLSVLFGVLVLVPVAHACPACRAEAQAAVYSPDFLSTTVLLLLPLAVIALVGVGVHFVDRCDPSPPTGL